MCGLHAGSLPAHNLGDILRQIANDRLLIRVFGSVLAVFQPVQHCLIAAAKLTFVSIQARCSDPATDPETFWSGLPNRISSASSSPAKRDRSRLCSLKNVFRSLRLIFEAAS